MVEGKESFKLLEFRDAVDGRGDLECGVKDEGDDGSRCDRDKDLCGLCVVEVLKTFRTGEVNLPKDGLQMDQGGNRGSSKTSLQQRETSDGTDE